MGYKDENILAATKRILLHEVIGFTFIDPLVPTDSEIGIWVAANFDIDTWDNVILVYNSPSYTTDPGNLNTFEYNWFVSYDPSVGFQFVTRIKDKETNGGSGGTGTPGSSWIIGGSPPTNGTGIDGDNYLEMKFDPLDIDHGNVYKKIAGNWGLVGNIKGPPGDTGPSGGMSNITIGTVNSIPSGDSAYASIGGSPPNFLLNLGIPRGRDGDDGVSPGNPNLTAGTITTLNPDDPATASIVGTYPNWQLNLGIPQGDKGDTGNSGTVFTVNTNSAATTLLPNSINVFGTDVFSAMPIFIYLPDVGGAGLNSIVHIVNANGANITINPQHGSFAGPNKTTLVPGEAITYFAVSVDPGNVLGYLWTALSKY